MIFSNRVWTPRYRYANKEEAAQPQGARPKFREETPVTRQEEDSPLPAVDVYPPLLAAQSAFAAFFGSFLASET
jgi:hypothetical protein